MKFSLLNTIIIFLSLLAITACNYINTGQNKYTDDIEKYEKYEKSHSQQEQPSNESSDEY